MKENDEKIKQLREAAYKIIHSERLPVPKDIKFRYSVSGTREQAGVCIKKRYNNGYRIIIGLVVAKYFEITKEETKKMKSCYFNEKKGLYYKRAKIGDERELDNIKSTLAHEIAHLKFWNHTPEHKGYQKHILKELNQHIGG